MSIKEILQNSIVLITSTDTENKSFGTGFVFWQENNDSYILTCAHVIEEVGKDKICVDSITQVELIACGARSNIDLAILKVTDLSKQILYLCNMCEQENIAFQISGFYQLTGAKIPIGKNIEGTTKSEIVLTKDLLNGWDLTINEDYKLQKGYSGSPIINIDTGKVFAIATHAEESGSGGYAISINHLLKIWKNPPDKLRDSLNENTKQHQDLSDKSCHLLIEFSRDRESYYTVQAWLAYPEQEFENVYVKDESINLHDETTSTLLTTELLNTLDKWNVNHGKVTLEFILPIELYSHPIEQWKNGDDDPIGAFYPIVVRSQERLRRKELKRFWKQIHPDLEMSLSNKVFWLEHPQAKLFHLKLKEHVCFALQFNPCTIKQSFLSEMLKYGVAVGLWACGCQDISGMRQQVNNEIFNNISLCNLPDALKEFRANQWANNQCDYHLTLFWDDKDRIPPVYQLQIPA